MDLLIFALAYPIAIALIFYFAFYRPIQRERNRWRKTISELRMGDRVVTQGGLIGTVKEVEAVEGGPAEVVLELGPGIEVRALATAIVERLGANSTHRTPSQEE